jgi:hypothetical protein
MKITQTITPGAIAPKDRRGPLTIDGSGELVLTRNPVCIHLQSDIAHEIGGLAIQNFQYVGFNSKYRLIRFMKSIPYVWRFLK